MLPERRYEPSLHSDLGALFKVILDLTKEEDEGMSKGVREYAKRGKERIKHPIENGGATPTEYAQLILRLAQFYPKEFEKLPILQTIRKKTEALLNRKPSDVVPLKLVG